MTPEEFIARWQKNKLSERAGAQGHFDDLCELLGVPKPRDPESYCFERGAKKSSGGDGWADVWKRGYFAWENKKPGRDLAKALKQLADYAPNLENPPLRVVCDRERIIIHKAFTGYPDEPHTIRIEELIDPSKRQILKWVFTDPQKLRPEKTTAAVTEEAASKFADLAEVMRLRGLDSNHVAHFLVQCLFCMFAEDEGLLPEKIFTNLLESAKADVTKAADRIKKLFVAMQKPYGAYGNDDIEWFNGGLFKQTSIPTLTVSDLETLRQASADMDWRAIDPTIFGTLFERGLGSKRAALGAHYTDTATIDKLVLPVVSRPLLTEWTLTVEKIKKQLEKANELDIALEEASRLKITTVEEKKELERKLSLAKKNSTEARNKANKLYQSFLLRLSQFRVFDPACGSGNFLYLALKALRDVEKNVHVTAEELGLEAETELHTGPRNILGLEINEFAAELARVTVWIGDIQWCRQNGWRHSLNPILKPLDGIENRDALLNTDGTETAWPKADVVVGNPPFLGGSVMRGELGDAYVETLRKTYAGKVPGGADLVCYWFEKARAQIKANKLQAAGLVSTQAIRKGSNRTVLDKIVADKLRIFLAWSDEPWINDGAAVRVSMTGFGKFTVPARLNDAAVSSINADLTSGDSVNLTTAHPLPENADTAFKGPEKSGDFDIGGELARSWLDLPNPNGKSNALVVKPWANGNDITKRPSDTWIIDYGVSISEEEAAFFEKPFEHIVEHVKPSRLKNNDKGRRENWWRFGRNGADMRLACSGLERFIATVRVAKHRFFVWLPNTVIPDTRLYVIARSDDCTFGILSSRFHTVWSIATASMHGVGNDPTYNGKSCFETFAFPEGFTPKDTKGASPSTEAAKIISAAAQKLDELRNRWLHPTNWVEWVQTPEEAAAGFPKRPVAKEGFEEKVKKLTLTNLYNKPPAWLTNAHQALDAAVAKAYGWEDYTPQISDEEILKRLFEMNLKRNKPATSKAKVVTRKE